MSDSKAPKQADDLQYVQYQADKEETYLPAIRQLISKDLSEPYSIYVYRYFLYQWGDLCFMVLLSLCCLEKNLADTCQHRLLTLPPASLA
jgi:hypothetical protein